MNRGHRRALLSCIPKVSEFFAWWGTHPTGRGPAPKCTHFHNTAESEMRTPAVKGKTVYQTGTSNASRRSPLARSAPAIERTLVDLRNSHQVKLRHPARKHAANRRGRLPAALREDPVPRLRAHGQRRRRRSGRRMIRPLADRARVPRERRRRGRRGRGRGPQYSRRASNRGRRGRET